MGVLAAAVPPEGSPTRGREGAVFFTAAAPMLGATGSNANLVFASGGQAPISDDTIERAEAILTPEQVGALREIQAEQEAAALMFTGARGATDAVRSYAPSSNAVP